MSFYSDISSKLILMASKACRVSPGGETSIGLVRLRRSALLKFGSWTAGRASSKHSFAFMRHIRPSLTVELRC